MPCLLRRTADTGYQKGGYRKGTTSKSKKPNKADLRRGKPGNIEGRYTRPARTVRKGEDKRAEGDQRRGRPEKIEGRYTKPVPEGYVRKHSERFLIMKRRADAELPRSRPSYTYSKGGYRPFPTGSYKPVPIKEYTPVAVKPYTPAPLKPYTPVPLKRYSPAPSKPYRVVPLKPYRAVPLKAYTPEPLKAYKPAPLKPYSPVPLKPYTPAPVKAYTPVPPKTYKLLGEKRTKGELIKGGTYSREICPYCQETIELRTSGVGMRCHNCKNKVRYFPD